MSKSLQLAWYLATRARGERRGPEDGPDAERAGFSPVTRRDGPLVWVHSGQDFDASAAEELTGRLLTERDDLNFVFTTSAKNRLDGLAEISRVFVPDDNVPSVRRFLDHWKPDIGVWTEPELRPAQIHERFPPAH